MLSAGETTRPRVIQPGMLGALVLAVAAVLALLFPGLDFAQSSHLARPDELSIAYLQQVLRTHADDRPARLLLARQQMALGHWDAARDSLALLVGVTDRVGWQARLSLVELDRARLEALPAGDPSRPEQTRQSVAAIRMLASAPLRPDELTHLAELALALDAPGEAAELYERVAARDRAHRYELLMLAARWKQAAGALASSAALYRAASADARTEVEAKQALGMAISVLVASDRGEDALALADGAVTRWPDDPRLLERAVTLALARGDGARARRWSERLIVLVPQDQTVLRRHLDIELGAGEIAAAFATASVLVAREPDDAGLRRRFAEIATWSGRPYDALRAWAWLAARGSEEAAQRTVALGHDLFDHARVAEVLQRKARAGTITLQELLDLSDTLESLGAPERARVFLHQAERSFSESPLYWRERAEVDEHLDELADALAAIREAGLRSGVPAEDAQREVELLWSLQRPQEALAAAQRAAPSIPADAVGFWRLYAELAWSLEDNDAAESAYRRLWSLDRVDADGAERLVTLLEGRKDVEGVIDIGGDAFVRFGTPSLLVAAVETAVEAERWQQAERLLAVGRARGGDALFADQTGLWSAVGRLEAHNGHPRQAAEAFAKVVARSPGASDAQEDLLWARVDAGLVRAPDDKQDQDQDQEQEQDEISASGGGDKPKSGGASERPDPGARLAMAIGDHDHNAVRELLADPEAGLTASEQVDAARELGDDEQAWIILSHAPPSTGDDEEDLALEEHRRELAEERLSGVWTSGGAAALGTLGLTQEKVRTSLRLRWFSVEVLAEHARLDANAGPVVSAVRADEWRAGVGLKLQETWGETRLEVGGHVLTTGGLPYANILQRWAVSDRLELDLEGLYHELPSNTAALRVAGLRDGVEGELKWQAGLGFSVGIGFGGNRYTARDGDPLATGWLTRAEVARLGRLSSLFVRVRADAFAEKNALVATLPASLTRLVRAGVRSGNLLPDSYATTGVGLTLFWRDEDDEIGSGKGCVRCLRPFTDVWAGWLLPAQRVTYNVEAGLGFLFARHQELSGTGFYYSDFGGESGQRYGGVSLAYTLRWL